MIFFIAVYFMELMNKYSEKELAISRNQNHQYRIHPTPLALRRAQWRMIIVITEIAKRKGRRPKLVTISAPRIQDIEEPPQFFTTVANRHLTTRAQQQIDQAERMIPCVDTGGANTDIGHSFSRKVRRCDQSAVPECKTQRGRTGACKNSRFLRAHR